MFKSKGRIVYDPYRGQMKNKTTWWCVVEIDKEITRYMRWWVANRYHIHLHQPSWDAHISVIRGERPFDDKKHLWKKYQNEEIEFEYDLNIRQGGDTIKFDRGEEHFWFIDVKCPKLTEIRDEFGFPSNWSHHITIGRTY